MKYFPQLLLLFSLFFAPTLGLAGVERQTTDKQQLTTGILGWSVTTQTTSGPVTKQILEVDLTAPGVQLLAYPGDGRLYTGEAPDETQMSLRQHRLPVAASINGDFWSNAGAYRFRPISLHVSDGILGTTSSHRSALMVTPDGRALIARTELEARLELENQTLPLSDINTTATTTGLTLLTSLLGFPIPATTTRPLVLFSLQTEGPTPNLPALVQVRRTFTTGTPLLMTNDMFVVWDENRFGQPPAPGTTATLQLRLTGTDEVIVQAIGGMPRLIADGEISLEADSVIETVPQGFSDTRDPRTAVGISEDGRKIWLIVVDGRRPDHSVGFSLQELAEFLLELGAYSAINLDGGGSSSITFMGQVLNKPSDGRVRPVTNSFHVIVHP